MAREQAENPFTMGLNRPTLIRELGLDPRNNTHYKRVKRRLDRLVSKGLVECHFLDGMYWYRPCFMAIKHSYHDNHTCRGTDFRRTSLHVEHNRRLLLAVKELLETVRVAGHGLFHGLKIGYIKAQGRVYWVLKGFFGVGAYKMPVVVRFYGYNQVLDRCFIERDKALYTSCKGAIIIVISTSYVERKALRLLRSLGVSRVYTLNVNVLMPYVRRQRLAEMREKAEERWERRIAFSRSRLKGIPRKPPICIPSEEFVRRFVNRLFRASARLYAYFRTLIRRWFPSIVRLEFEYLEEMRRLLAASMIGSRKGVKIHRLELERINSLLSQIFKTGLSPPGVGMSIYAR